MTLEFLFGNASPAFRAKKYFDSGKNPKIKFGIPVFSNRLVTEFPNLQYSRTVW